MHYFQFRKQAEGEILYSEESDDNPVRVQGADFDQRRLRDRELVDAFRLSSSTHGGPVELNEEQFESLRQLLASKRA
jgi:hypothetical protein